jgi:hypothetical protein
MKKLHQFMLVAEKRGASHLQLAPTVGRIVTLSDIDDISIEHATTTIISATDAQLQDFNNAKVFLYVFVLSHYEDETIQGHAYWETQACVYYVVTWAYFHACGPDTIEKIVGSRFP